MGTTRFEFDPDELVCVGGDYGQIHVAGATDPARSALDTVVGAVRHGGHQPGISLVLVVDDSETAFIESRHAGREGTTEGGGSHRIIAPADDVAAGAEGGAEEGTGDGEAGSNP